MPRKAFFTRFPGFRGSLPAPLPPCGNGCAALTIGGRRKIKYPRLASPSFRAQTRNLWNLAVWTSTAPESIFVASACEYGVAVQGDGLQLRVTVYSSGRPFFYVLEKKPTPPCSLGNKIPSLVFCSRKFSAKTYPISIATK